MAENNKIIETYADDMAEVIEKEGGNLVKKIIQGEEKHEEEKKNLSPESKRNRIFIWVGFFLIFLSVSALLYFFVWREKNKPIEVMQQFVPLIFHDQSIFIEVGGLNKDEIKQVVLNHVEATEVKSEGVEGIYLTENKQVIGLRRFLAMIESNFLPGDNLLLVQDGFLMGVFNNHELPNVTGKGFFLLMKMLSISDVFNSMRTWEGKMLSDLHKFIGVEISKDTNYLFTKDFDNGIVGNKNARIIHDQDGKLILMYVFADENSVVITDSMETAQEILLRLASKQREQ
jgi:hypothetical protein